jgi:hypothetical protein
MKIPKMKDELLKEELVELDAGPVLGLDEGDLFSAGGPLPIPSGENGDAETVAADKTEAEPGGAAGRTQRET